MVTRDIAARGITDPRVLAALNAVPRERFLPIELAESAYDDHPLPIAEHQTISQPYIVAFMAQAAEVTDRDRVLEVGTGSGYGAAVLSRLAAEVWTIERHPALSEQAATILHELGIDNVHLESGDGSLGWPDGAPYDAIVVTAGAPRVPPALVEQLADSGRLVIPIGPESLRQELVRVRKNGGTPSQEELGGVRFVPLLGSQGWHED